MASPLEGLNPHKFSHGQTESSFRTRTFPYLARTQGRGAVIVHVLIAARQPLSLDSNDTKDLCASYVCIRGLTFGACTAEKKLTRKYIKL